MFAYHDGYWRRWGPARKRSGRKRRAAEQPAVDDDADCGPHDGAHGGESGGIGEGEDRSGPHEGAGASGEGGAVAGQGGSVREMIDFWERVGTDAGGNRGADQAEPQFVMDGEGMRVGVPARGRGRGRAGRPRTRTVMETGRGRRRADTAYVWSPMNRDAYERTQSVVPQRFERGEGGSYNEGV